MLEFHSADGAQQAALFEGHTIVLVRATTAAASQHESPIHALPISGGVVRELGAAHVGSFDQHAAGEGRVAVYFVCGCGSGVDAYTYVSAVYVGVLQQAEVKKAGHFVSENVPPIAGGAAFSTQNRNALCLNLEVYQIASRKITIIQQRASPFTGRAHAFAQELVEWAVHSKVSSLCVVSGTDDMLRHDPNMLSRPIRAIYSGESKELVNPAFIEHFTALSTTSDVPPVDTSANVWESVRGSGIAPLLFKKCEESKVPFAALLMACAEGDNVPDAVAMASHVITYLQLVPAPEASAQPPRVPFVFPPSWSQLFGRGPDVSLYL